MRRQDELTRLAQESGSSRARRSQALRPPSTLPQFASEGDTAEARAILIQQRIGDDSFQDPTKQKRKIFRTKAKNEALADPETWTFSLNERAIALHTQIRWLASVGVAQALIEFDPTDPVDVNILHTDKVKWKLKKGRSKPPVAEYNEHLEHATKNDSVAHITLLVTRGARQVSKDRALGIALSLKLTNATEELLRYDANPNAHWEHFCTAIKEGNLELVELFLSAPRDLETSYIISGLSAAVERKNHGILSLLLAYGADGISQNSQSPFVAVRGQNQLKTAAILTNSLSCIRPENLDQVVREACAISDNACRTTFLNLLLSAGATASTPLLQDELFKAVRSMQLDLVALLISHGTSPDRHYAEVVEWALKEAKFEAVDLLLRGTISPNSASRLMDSIPDIISEARLQGLVIILANKGAYGESLGRCLARAVDNGFKSVPIILVDRGASVDYDTARSVRFLLKARDIELLGKVLKGSSSPAVLSKVLPEAMAIRSRPLRRQAMSLLLTKGVVGRELNVALQEAVSESPETRDHSLIEILVEHQASVSFMDANGNCIQMAAKQGDLRTLQQLCRGKFSRSSVDILSSAVPLAFASIRNDNYTVVLQILRLLLHRGALGTPVADTLVQAVCQDHGHLIVALLLDNGADVNHLNGKATEKALTARNTLALQILCDKGRFKPQTLERLMPEALSPENWDQTTAHLIVKRCAEYPELLSSALLDEVEVAGARQQVIELLLQHGANVSFNRGAALRRAVLSGDIETTCLLVAVNPGKPTLRLAFEVAAELADRSTRYGMMQVLLQHGESGIGQDEALVREAIAPSSDGLSHVKLLIDHAASVDYQEGAAMQGAIRAKHEGILKLLLSKSPSAMSLANAFLSARHLPCPKHERLALFNLLLRAGVRGSQVHQALIESAERELTDLDIPRLLLRHDASVDFSGGQVLEIAARSGSRNLLKLLVRSGSQPSLEAAFLVARQTFFSSPRLRFDIFECLLKAGVRGMSVSEALIEAAQRDASDLQLPHLLLSHKASVNLHDGRSLRLAVKAGSVALLTVLVAGQANTASVESAFRKAKCVLLSGEQRIDIYRCLLKAGIRQDEVSAALLEAVPTGSKDLVDLLLFHGANVSRADGKCFVMAATQGDIEIFKALTAHGPDMGLIVPTLIRSLDDEALLVQYIQLCFDGTSTDASALSNSLIFTALERFPLGSRLIQLLLDRGCIASSTRESQVDEDAGPETVTALLWALHQPEPGISDSVILTLLGAEVGGTCNPSLQMLLDANILVLATVNFVASKSRMSAVMIAAQRGRHVVLQTLLGLGADPSLRDGKKCSPLFYASQNGDLEAVKLLVQAQARPDDGSLHEAARQAHPEVVSYLLAHDHHMRLPSSQHSDGVSGRTALEELCLRGTPDGDGWETRVHRTIELLLSVGGEAMMKSDGKSLLHYALDNKTGPEVTEALLQFAPIWERINDPIHLYEDATGITYSATQYVEHFCKGSIAMRNKLIQLLKGKKCQDRYYRQTAEQPMGALGLPDDISAAIKRQENADWELKEDLRREDMLTEHQRKMQNLNHNSSQQISAEKHDQAMQYLHSDEAFTRTTTQPKHTRAFLTFLRVLKIIK
jgi:ankyrin repeat protein